MAFTTSNGVSLLAFSASSPVVVSVLTNLRGDPRVVVVTGRRRDIEFPMFFLLACTFSKTMKRRGE